MKKFIIVAAAAALLMLSSCSTTCDCAYAALFSEAPEEIGTLG